jgi:hypothetical protein
MPARRCIGLKSTKLPCFDAKLLWKGRKCEEKLCRNAALVWEQQVIPPRIFIHPRCRYARKPTEGTMTRLMKDRGAFPQSVLTWPDPPPNRPGEKEAESDSQDFEKRDNVVHGINLCPNTELQSQSIVRRRTRSLPWSPRNRCTGSTRPGSPRGSLLGCRGPAAFPRGLPAKRPTPIGLAVRRYITGRLTLHSKSS